MSHEHSAAQATETSRLTGGTRQSTGGFNPQHLIGSFFGGGTQDTQPKRCTPCGKALTATSIASGLATIAFIIAAVESPAIWYYTGGFGAAAVATGATSIGTGITALCMGRR